MAESSMKIVHPGDPKQPPGWCAFTHDIDSDFLDTGRWITNATGQPSSHDSYGYVQVAFVKEMGRAVGMVEGDEVAVLQERLEAMMNELVELRSFAEKVTTAKSLVGELSAMSVPAEPQNGASDG